MDPLMLLILLFAGRTGADIVSSVRLVSVQRGGSVTISCSYQSRYESHVKYWCRGSDWNSCRTIVRTDFPQKKDEVSISDDSDQQVFTVIMNNLKTGGSDTYWCGVEISGPDVGQKVSLSITDDVSTMSTVTVHSGGSVTIPCFYDKMYQHHEKYWCKGSDWSSCTPKVRTNRPKISGEVSIRDDPNQRFFTVTMNNLKTVDSDDYWCAVEISRGSAVGRRVYLSVTEGVSTLSTVTVQRGGSVTIPCAYDDGYKTHVKYWCKGSDWSSCAAIVRTDSPHEGKVSVRDDPDQQVFTVTMNNLTDGDSGSYWCGVEISKGSAVGKRVSLSVPEDDEEGGNNEKQSSLVQLALYVGLGLFVLLLIIIIITWKVWDIRKKKRAMDQNPGSTELSQVSSRCSSHHSAVRSANNVVYSSFTMKHIE